jgi:hypothetical protein
LLQPLSGAITDGVYGADNSPLTPGMWTVRDQADSLSGLALEVLPVILPHKKRRLVDEELKTVCYSNDMKHALKHGAVVTDDRNGKTVVINTLLGPNEALIDDKGLAQVGGCDRCPLGEWVKDGAGKWLPSACQESSVVILYVYGSYFPVQGVHKSSPLAAFRTNGFDPKSFQEYSWDEFVAYDLKGMAHESLDRGQLRVQGQKEQTLSFAAALEPFILSRKLSDTQRGWFSKFAGLPRHLLAFEVNGEVVNLETALSAGVEPVFIGLYTLRLTTTLIKNKSGADVIVPILELPKPGESPVIMAGTDEFNKWVTAQQQAKAEGTLALLGWRSVVDPTQIALPAPVSAPQLVSGEVYQTEEDAYGLLAPDDDLEDLLD